MKKLLYLGLACFCFSTAALAQKISRNDLQGNWKLTFLNAGGIMVNPDTQEVTIAKELESQLAPEVLEQIKGSMSASMDALQSAYLAFDKDRVTQSMAGESDGGTFTITENEGQQYMQTKYDDGTLDEALFYIKDNLLHVIVMDEGQETEMTYTRQ
jgi:hypothetical protein